MTKGKYYIFYGLGSLWAVLSAPAWWARFRKPMSFELENA